MSDFKHQPIGAPEGSSDSSVARACAQLSRWTGLELYGSAPRRVEEFLQTRAAQLGYASQVEYIEFLSAQKPTDPEAQRLINLVTNGLTCFWRDLPQLDALRAVLEESSQAKADAAALKIWCAGCSTGEEAYTVAMMAVEAGVPVEVLGSDINTDSLQQAVAGVFGEWSLRRTRADYRARYFDQVGPARWAVRPELRRMVRFERHNILTPAPRPSDGGGWDIILCRNVMIYFSQSATETVLRLFSAALNPDGYLLLGSSEQLHTGGVIEGVMPFRAARRGGGFVYRLRRTPPGKTVFFSTPERALAEGNPAQTLDLTTLSSLEEITSDVRDDSPAHPAAERLFEMALEHLRAGHHEAAIACCEASASYDPFICENYCLMGYLLHQSGAYSQALSTYRKALFLEPFNWPAALEGGRISLHLGDEMTARRLLRQTLEGVEAGRARSTQMEQLACVMTQAITDEREAREFCARWLARLQPGEPDEFAD